MLICHKKALGSKAGGLFMFTEVYAFQEARFLKAERYCIILSRNQRLFLHWPPGSEEAVQVEGPGAEGSG